MTATLNKEGWVSKLDGHSWNQKYMAVYGNMIYFFKKKPEAINSASGGSADLSVQIKLVCNLSFSVPKSHWRNQGASSDSSSSSSSFSASTSSSTSASSSSSKTSGRAFFYLKIDYFTANLGSMNSIIIRFEVAPEFDSWTKLVMDSLHYHKRTHPQTPGSVHATANANTNMVSMKDVPYQLATPAPKQTTSMTTTSSLTSKASTVSNTRGSWRSSATTATASSLQSKQSSLIGVSGERKAAGEGTVQAEEFVKRAQLWGEDANTSEQRLEERNEENNIKLIKSSTLSSLSMLSSSSSSSSMISSPPCSSLPPPSPSSSSSSTITLTTLISNNNNSNNSNNSNNINKSNNNINNNNNNISLKCTEHSAFWFGVSDQREFATIHYACKLGCVEGVRQLLDACGNACIGLPDKYHGWTPLHWACRWDAAAVAKLLVERGADVTTLDRLGRPPAVVALQYGARACYGILSSASSAAGLVLPEGFSNVFAMAARTKVHGLHVLAALGTVPAFRKAVREKRGAEALLCLADGCGRTPLHYAAGAGNLGCLRALIDLGVSLSAADQAGRTPLMAAAEGGHAECMRALLALGASTQPAAGDVTLLHAAVRSGSVAAVQAAQPFCSPRAPDAAGRTPIMLACAGAPATGLELIAALCGANAALAGDALHHAAAAGDATLAGRLLDMGADPCAADALGRLPIHCCASPDVCRTLIVRARAVPTAPSVRGERLTPLHWACKLNHYGVIDFLVDIGVDIEAPTSAGRTPLVVACENKAPQALAKLLARGARPVGKMPSPPYAPGTSPFLAALQNGDHESALALSEVVVATAANSSIQSTQSTSNTTQSTTPQQQLGAECDANGESALRKAIRGGSAECVALTLELGADAAAADSEGNTALHLAAKLGNVSALACLAGLNRALVGAENAMGFTPLHLAALHGHGAAVAELLKLGADVGATAAKSGSVTPLACAIRGKSESVFNTLVEFAPLPRQGNPSVIFSEVNKALLKSKNPRDVEFGKRVIEKALALGMDPNIRIDNNYTLLQIAIGSSVELSNMLLSYKQIDVNAGDKYGKTPLMIACKNRNLELVKRLLSMGANPNTKRSFGFTALHESTLVGDIDIATILVENGADANAKALMDITPLHNAASFGNVELLKTLVEKGGADVNAKTLKGQTALDICVSLNYTECIGYLSPKTTVIANSNVVNGTDVTSPPPSTSSSTSLLNTSDSLISSGEE